MTETSSAISPIPVNALAAAYQPRRVFAALLSITWNLLLAAMFLLGGGAWKLQRMIEQTVQRHHLFHTAIFPIYLAVIFATLALLNYPVELWFGYLEERQFGLAKDGIRAWSRDWLSGVVQHGAMFITGSSILMILQVRFPRHWLLIAAAFLAMLFLLTSYGHLSLVPRGLFQLETASTTVVERLSALLSVGGINLGSARQNLPPIIIFSAPNLRDFSGGLIGLGNREALLLSRSTLAAASDNLLRFILLHELGHRRYHHPLLATLAGWAWVVLGLCISDVLIRQLSPQSLGLPPYLAWLMLTFSGWMAAGEPILAYMGRRLEYQADRFYLRHGGKPSLMQDALEELSNRNLARTEGLQRRQTMFHPLPSVWNRLHAARRFVETMDERKQ